MLSSSQVEQLVADVRMVQNAYSSHQQKKSQVVCGTSVSAALTVVVQEKAASEREELLSRRYTPNVSSGLLTKHSSMCMHHTGGHTQCTRHAYRAEDILSCNL